MKTPGFRLSLILILSLLLTVVAAQVAIEQHRVDKIFHVGEAIQSQSTSVVLEKSDFVLEPGEFSDTEELNRFFLRQGQISKILQDKPGINFSWDDLPLVFWIQIFVGLGAMFISGWVWALRPKDLAPRLFALSGFTVVLFTHTAAVYTTRQVAMSPSLFQFLWNINAAGSVMYGVTMFALFLVYPVRLSYRRELSLLVTTISALWLLFSIKRWIPAWAGVNLIILIEMIILCMAIVAQFYATRRNPKDRAALTWLGLSVILGAGAFIVMNTVPLIVGSPPMDQAYAFSFLLIIYLGLAAGVSRFRLFEVGIWAYRLLFYAFGATLLLALDAILILMVGMDRLPALGIALLGIGIIYLPLRDGVWRKFSKNSYLDSSKLLSESLHVAFAPSAELRAERWILLIKKLFDPLEILEIDIPANMVKMHEDGAEMFIPSVANVPPLKISFPWSGTKLFTNESAALATQIVFLIKQAESSRSAYDRGVSEERKRLAKDLHDDVGARLLTGLHNADEKHKPAFQAALSDIRSIVSEIAGEQITTENWAASLKFETSRRLSAMDITMEWPVLDKEYGEHTLNYRQHRALTSAVREVVSNVIRHSGATSFKVLTEVREGKLRISCWDNGKGFSGQAQNGGTGFGLKNIRDRVEDIGGVIEIKSSEGCHIFLSIPIG